jgi:hypothetical protein
MRFALVDRSHSRTTSSDHRLSAIRTWQFESARVGSAAPRCAKAVDGGLNILWITFRPRTTWITTRFIPSFHDVSPQEVEAHERRPHAG